MSEKQGKQTKGPLQEEDEKGHAITIREGYIDEVVLTVEYNAAQIARCVEETYRLFASAEPEPEYDAYALWPNSSRGDNALYPESSEEFQATKKGRLVKLDPKASEKKEQLFFTIDTSDDRKAFHQAASSYTSENLPNALEKFYLNFIRPRAQ